MSEQKNEVLLPVPGVPEVLEQISNIRERQIELPSDNEINLLIKDAEINDLKEQLRRHRNQLSFQNFPSPVLNPLSGSSGEIVTLLKIMPIYNGRSDENFDSWVIVVKSALEYGPNCTEKQKLDAIKVKIGGDAREMVNCVGVINTVDSLFVAMRHTYGRDKRAILANVKQRPDETVKMFSMRLKTAMQNLGWVESENTSDNPISLDYFLAGLRTEISDKVKSLLPINFEFAEKYAMQLEGSKV